MTGLLLVNLGTPEAPTTPAVRRYLREFLSDPYVIDINPIARAALLNLVILPRRPARSAEAYRKIWTDRGSPLLFHSVDLVAAVRERLPDVKVALGMRYGAPSLAAGLRELHEAGCERVVVIPLYPQFARASTVTSIERIRTLGAELWGANPPLIFVESFYEDPHFIRAFAAVTRPILDEMKPDHLLMSFHGLPVHQVKACAASGSSCTEASDCCDRIDAANTHCYRAQSYATARALAAELDLDDGSWSVSFQSRLGRRPWIEPYTDKVVPELASRGIERLAVVVPSFVADCLETLEEIAIRAADDFATAGGGELRLIESLNSHPAWADCLAHLARGALAGDLAVTVAAAPAGSSA